MFGRGKLPLCLPQSIDRSKAVEKGMFGGTEAPPNITSYVP